MATESFQGQDYCSSLKIGSFYFINVNAWPTQDSIEAEASSSTKRHGEAIIFGFQDIPGNLDLYLTDRAWSDNDGGKFVPNTVQHEGILKLTTPPEGIPAGIPFGVGDDAPFYAHGSKWVDVDLVEWNGGPSQIMPITNQTEAIEKGATLFDLGMDGDQVFLYCVDGNGNDRPIAGLSYNGPFEKQDFYGTNKSSAPRYFQEYDETVQSSTSQDNPKTTSTLLVMPSSDQTFLSWQYIGPMSGDFDRLQDAIRDTEHNWVGFNPDGTQSSSSSQIFRTDWLFSNVMGVILLCFLIGR